MLLKKLFLSNLILTLTVVAFVVSVKAQSSEWKSSEKRDNIETYYQVEKVGTDSFEVTIKIKNNRSKEVKVEAKVLFKTETSFGGGILAPSSPTYASSTRCKEAVASGGSTICKPIQVTAKKIVGVKIVCWYNVGGKCVPKGDLPPSNL